MSSSSTRSVGVTQPNPIIDITDLSFKNFSVAQRVFQALVENGVMALPTDLGEDYVRHILSDRCWNNWSNGYFAHIPHLCLSDSEYRKTGRISHGWFLLSQYFAHGINKTERRRQIWVKDQNYSLITGRVIGNAAPLALLRKADFSSVSYKQRKMLGEVVIVEILWGWYVGKVLRVEPQGADDAIYTVVVDQSQREGVVTCRSHQMGKLSSVGKQMAQLASPYLSQVLCKQDYAERFQVRQLSKAEAVLEKNYMESQLKEPQTKEKLNTEISGELFRLEARGEKFWQEYDPRWNSFWNRYFGRYGLAVQRLEESSFSALQLLRQFYSSSSHRNDPRALRCFVNYHHSPHSKWRPMINKPVPLWLLKRTLFGAAGRPGKVATTWRWVVYEHKLRGIYVFGRAISQENQMNRRGYKVKVLEIGDYDPLIQNSLGRAFMGPCIRWVAEELLGFFPEALLPLPEPPSRRFSSMASSHGVASSTLVDPLARHASLSATSLPKRSSQDLY